jgi:DNA-directed RNA polymerase subunit K/omega
MSQYIQDMIDTKRGKYLLVNALARRVRALQSGSKVLVNRHSANSIDVAMDEFRQGKIHIIDKGISIADELAGLPDKHARK